MITSSVLVKGLKQSIDYREPVVRDKNAFKVLISTVLSQRTRDENTAKASKKLFSKYSTPKQIANAKIEELEELVKSSGFYRVKAKRIKQISKEIIEKFGGEVPDNIDELLTLTGVGRKTANCVLVYAYNKPAIPVDVHVHRISNRMGLVKTRSPDETEEELTRIIPRKYWIKVNHLMVLFGRNVCLPRNPKCAECVFNEKCEHGKKTLLRDK